MFRRAPARPPQHAQANSEPQRALRKAPTLTDENGPCPRRAAATARKREAQKKGERVEKKPWIEPLRVKYNAACTVGTFAALAGSYYGAHFSEALTHNAVFAATVGSLAVSMVGGVGGFMAAWSAIRFKDFKDKKELGREVLKLGGKNLAAAVLPLVSRVPTSWIAVSLGLASEWSGVLGFVVAQVVFYSGANLLTRNDFNSKNQNSKGKSNSLLDTTQTDIKGERQNEDIRG